MKFCEHGERGARSMMLLPGNMMTHRQFDGIVPLLAKDHRVVTVSFDGFDESGETTYTTAADQAAKLAEYIRCEMGGRVDLVLSESLGGAPAAHLTRCEGIAIGGIIMDGASYWNLGVLNGFAKATLYRIPYGVVSRARKAGRLVMPGWLLKSMGLTQEFIDSIVNQMCLTVSAETLKATFIEGIDLYPAMDTWQPCTDIPIACWYGEKEANMKKAVQSMRRAFPEVEVRAFPELGHGELIGDTERFAGEIQAFMAAHR